MECCCRAYVGLGLDKWPPGGKRKEQKGKADGTRRKEFRATCVLARGFGDACGLRCVLREVWAARCSG